MMPSWVPLAVAMFGSVALVLRGEATGNRLLVWVFKPLASSMFVAIAWLRFGAPDPPGAWILLALLLCFAGDVLLTLERGFLPGLVAFLVGHVAYVVAFHAMAPAQTWPVVLAVPVVVSSALATNWLWPHLGRMRLPVLTYVTVITVMVWAAAGAVDAGVAPARALVGALLFYASDLAVARQRFMRPSFVNRAWGLPAYYLGQTLLALTVAR